MVFQQIPKLLEDRPFQGTRQKRTLKEKIQNAMLLVPLLLVLLPFLVVFAVFYWLYRIALHLMVCVSWLPKGKDVLLIYSNSPIWHEYITTQILPLIQERAIVLNWSERKEWSKWSLSVRAFYLWGYGRDYNPMVMLFRPLKGVKRFRFFSAFKAWKHGKIEEVEQLRSELIQACAASR